MSITLNTAQHLRDNLLNLNENLLGLDKKIKLIDTRLQNPILLVIGIIFTLGILQLVFVIQKAVIKAQMRKINAEIIHINAKQNEGSSSNSSPELPQTPRIITEKESPKPEAPTELEIIAEPEVITEEEIIAQPEVIAEEETAVEQETPAEQEVFTETKEDEAIAAVEEYQPTSEELHEKFDPAIDEVLEKIAATVNRAENAEEVVVQANAEVVQAAARATLAKNIASLVRGSKIRKAMKNAKAAISELKKAEAAVAQSFLDCNNIFKKWETERKLRSFEEESLKDSEAAHARLQMAKEKEEKLSKAADEALMKLGLIRPGKKK